jgi:hypothetical protein
MFRLTILNRTSNGTENPNATTNLFSNYQTGILIFMSVTANGAPSMTTDNARPVAIVTSFAEGGSRYTIRKWLDSTSSRA